MKKMIEKAEAQRISGDEESSFVMYMKFMNLLSKLQKNPDFHKEKALITKMIGNNTDISKHFDRMVVLKASLELRYAKAYPTKASSIVESTIMNVDQEIAVIETATQEVREVIDCKALFDMLEGGEKLLIMDCRSAETYEQSKMSYKYTMNVPEDILKLGMTASKIQERLPNDSKVFWNMRENRRFIIFVDWFSKRFNRNSPVWHLKEILMEWDQDVEKKPEMLLLEGGYEKWKTVYPMKCFNPQFSPPKAINGDTPAIEDIEYPNLEDIQMKDSSLNISSPQIDRSMKLNAMKAYETSKTSLQLLEENEQIMDMSLRNERELLNLETDLKQIVSNKENNEDSTAQEQSYMFKIWELQSKQTDINVKEKSIKEQLELSKDQVQEPREMTKVMQVEQHVKEMETERRRVHEEREQKKKEREEALKFARDNKPSFNDHRTPPKSQRKEEIILSPKALNQVNTPSIPSFDRAAKPMQTVSRQIFSDQDFSPVYGRVVS